MIILERPERLSDSNVGGRFLIGAVMSRMDLAIDLMAMVGLLLCAWAVYGLAGIPGVVGYLGGLLIVAAVVLAMKRARDEDGDL